MRALSFIALVAVLTGCPKNESTTTTVDAASSAPAASVSQVTLAPLDTGAATASASATSTAPTATLGTPPAHSGVVLKPGDAGLPAIPTATSTAQATPAAQAQLKQCCAALHKQSQQHSPQAPQLAQAATMCDGLAAAMAGAPTMPQLDQVKMLLQGVPMPPVCQGL